MRNVTKVSPSSQPMPFLLYRIKIKGRLLSRNYRILKVEFRCILIVMKSVLAKIKRFIMKFINIF